MTLHADVVATAEEANALHLGLESQMDPAMSCDQQHTFPPSDVVAAALTRQDFTLFAAYDDDTSIAGAIVITNSAHRQYGRVIWFYAAAGRHDDAVSVLTPVVVDAVGSPYGVVQNPAVAAAFQQGFSDNVDTQGTTLSWT